MYQGITNKVEKLLDITNELQYVAYIGDDINDLSCMRIIKQEGGIVGCPADADKKVVEISDFVSNKNEGDGAVRDFIEWLI